MSIMSGHETYEGTLDVHQRMTLVTLFFNA